MAGERILEHWGQSASIDVNILTVKILNRKEYREHCEEFNLAKIEEVKGLQFRKVWSPVNETDIPTGANIMGVRFFQTLKKCKSPY